MTGNSARIAVLLTPAQKAGIDRIQQQYGLKSPEDTLNFIVQLVINSQIKIEIQHTLGDSNHD